MSVAGNHIIEKVFIEVNTKSEKRAFQIKDNVSLFLEQEIFPALEELFNKYDTHGKTIRFDRLDVDFSIEDWNKSEGIKFEFLKCIERKISEARPEVVTNLAQINFKVRNKIEPSINSKQIMETEQNYRSTFLFFLENGYLSWFGRQEYISKLLSLITWKDGLKQTSFLFAIKRLLLKKETAINRFVLQFSDELIITLIAALNILHINNTEKLVRFMQHSEISFRNCFLKCLINMSINPPEKKKDLAELVIVYAFEKEDFEPTQEFVKKVMDEISTEMQLYFTQETVRDFFTNSKEAIQSVKNELIDVESNIQSGWGPEALANSNSERIQSIAKDGFVNTEKEKEPPFFETHISDIVVRNAGLVLFWPFLNTFFKHFEWISENGGIKTEHLFEAVQAVHFCATGKENFFEANLIFEKFLCGVPLNVPISGKSRLNKEVKREVDNLLQQVVRNWPELKNTSPDGLRQMFVHRDGKLIQKERGFKLIVERKVQDILLDKLPWSVSLVKLPWKDELLFVEW